MSFKSFITSTKHTISAKSPEICVALGLGALVVAVFTAAKAAPKAQKAKAENDEIKETMDEALEKGETASDDVDENGNSVMIPYTEEDYKNDMKLYIGKKIVNETKPYVTSGLLTISGIVLVLIGMGILKKREAAAISLVGTMTAFMKDYRKRVRDDVGPAKELEYYTGIKKETVKEQITDEKGKKKTIEVEKTTQLDSSVENCPWLSPYAVKITSSNCRQFESLCGDPIYVAHWLTTTQEMMNTHLHTDGILYLDWVLDQLGIMLDTESNPTLDSFIAHNVGWIDTDYYYDTFKKTICENNGDRYVDFGCWDSEGNLTLTRGKDGSVYLDFNVDGWINGRMPRKNPGYILDQIEKHPEIER